MTYTTSATQQALITLYCNDTNEGTITSTIMDNFYDARSGDFDKTVCDCIELKIGAIAGDVDTSAPEIGGTRASRSQRVLALERALERWKVKAGLTGGTLQTGILDMEIDYEDSAS